MSTPISPTERAEHALDNVTQDAMHKARANAILQAVEDMDTELAATQASDAELRAKPPWAGILNGLTGAL
jgi:hypothetical protein